MSDEILIFINGIVTGLIFGWMIGEITAMRRQRKHEERIRRFRQTGIWS